MQKPNLLKQVACFDFVLFQIPFRIRFYWFIFLSKITKRPSGKCKMSQFNDITDVKVSIRAVLSSSQNELTVNDLSRDYKKFDGAEIPFKKFGYRSLAEFLRSIPDTVTVTLHHSCIILMLRAVIVTSLRKLCFNFSCRIRIRGIP